MVAFFMLNQPPEQPTQQENTKPTQKESVIEQEESLEISLNDTVSNTFS